MPTFYPLPPAFFDPTVSDADLQEQWTKGGLDAYQRLLRGLSEAALAAVEDPHEEAWDDVRQAYEACKRARQFVVDAAGHLQRYRRER